MSDGWLHPGKYERLQITGCTGPGTQYHGYTWKFVLHSTESPPGSINGINNLFRSQPCSCPHFTVDPGNNRRVQYIPWTWSACALRGGRNGFQTNRGRAVQMEVCGYARDAANWSDETLWLIADVIADVVKDGCPVNPHTVRDMTRLPTGVVLASEHAPQRMSPQAFKDYDGITFHVECPFNDHWDQGRVRSLDLARMVREILAGAGVPIPGPSGGGGSSEIIDVGYMKMGMAGGIVTFLQELLIGLGYSCGPTGADSDFGPATDAAVRAFQGDNGLVVDGIWGPASGQAMSAKYAPVVGRPVPPPPPTAGSNVPVWPERFLLFSTPMMSGDDVRVWQQQMADRGWRIGVDGWFGLDTLAVVKTFQEEKGLEKDGVIGRQTWNAAWTAAIT